MATIKLTDEIKDVIRKSKIEGSSLMLPGTLDRSLYVKVNAVFLAQKLEFKPTQFLGTSEAQLLNPDGTLGVRFSLTYYPTCYRRGPFRVVIDVLSGPFHHSWGCFDEQDQPLRNYHDEKNAIDEAERIAAVLIADFDPGKKAK